MTSTEPAGQVRPTRQRRAIAAVLEVNPEFLSAQQIHDLLRGRGEAVGLSTVYRTLQALADTGGVDVLHTEAGEALYRSCSAWHHHHLLCRSCGATVEIIGPPVESWTRSIAADHGFSDVSHTLELFGTCPNCGSR